MQYQVIYNIYNNIGKNLILKIGNEKQILPANNMTISIKNHNGIINEIIEIYHDNKKISFPELKLFNHSNCSLFLLISYSNRNNPVIPLTGNGVSIEDIFGNSINNFIVFGNSKYYKESLTTNGPLIGIDDRVQPSDPKYYGLIQIDPTSVGFNSSQIVQNAFPSESSGTFGNFGIIGLSTRDFPITDKKIFIVKKKYFANLEFPVSDIPQPTQDEKNKDFEWSDINWGNIFMIVLLIGVIIFITVFCFFMIAGYEYLKNKFQK